MLGEAIGLLNGVGTVGLIGIAIAAAISLAAMPAVLPRFFVGRGRWGQGVVLGRKYGRLLSFLFLFFLIGIFRGRQARNWRDREMNLGLDSRRWEVEGKVRSIGQSSSGTGLVLVLEDCEVRGAGTAGEWGEFGRLGRIQVYVDEGSVERAGSAWKAGDAWKAGSAWKAGDAWKAGSAGRIRSLETDGDMQVPGLRIGNRVQVTGTVRKYRSARNPGAFDSRLYALSQKINYRIFSDRFSDSCQILDTRYYRLRDGLYRLSLVAGHILDQIANPLDAGIYRAALLGEKSRLDKEIRNLYQRNGIAHLLAISGLHLSLISGAAYGGLRKLGLGYGKAGLVGGGLLLAYAIMTGASPSVVRALIMVLCGFLAAYLGRTYDLLSALGLAALLLLWDNPYRLYQAGVQLSFAAVAGIGGLGPWLVEDGMERLEELESWLAGDGSGGMEVRSEDSGVFRKVGPIAVQAFGVSLGMQMMTLPVVLYHYYQYPLYGLFLNLLVVPLMGLVLGSGIIGILMGSIWLPAGRLALVPGHGILKLYERLCLFCERLPGSSLIVGRPEGWQIAAYYGGMALALWIWRLRPGRGAREIGNTREARGARYTRETGGHRETGGIYRARRTTGTREIRDIRETRRAKDTSGARATGARFAAALLLGFSLCLLCPRPLHGLEVTFLDVGQGDGICIRTRSEVILVDGGSSDQKNLGERQLEPFLKSKGIRRVDCVVVSHGDRDHTSGLIDLLEKSDISVEQLILPAAGQGDEAYDELIRLAGERNCPVRWMKAGDRLTQRRSGRSFGSALRKIKDGFVLGKFRDSAVEKTKTDNSIPQISQKELSITCLYPPALIRSDTHLDTHAAALKLVKEPVQESDRNEHSLVLRVDYGNFHMLLTGDMSAEGEKALLAEQGELGRTGNSVPYITDDSARRTAPIRDEAENRLEQAAGNRTDLSIIQVLKVAHHGSRFSTGEEWLDALSPSWAVLSYGEGNRYGHPASEVVERLKERGIVICETAKSGAVCFITDGEQLWLKPWIGKEKMGP